MRNLSEDEIVEVLRRGKIGRLGTYDEIKQRVYVVPVSYWYGDGVVYLHSAPGLKLDLLNERPTGVCFQVDEIADEGDWVSVIGWGAFEEITEPADRQRVLRAFGERLLHGPLRERQHLGRGGLLGAGETVYRLVLGERTGRADSSGWFSTESD